ncbi:MAG: glycosyltransferase family 2 protein [Nitrosopumilus sp.]|nr:glycosyltransferase family 2 protein [Nitrosopumilus sp.]
MIPIISIIIINYSEKKLLSECLQSVKKTNYENYEIIVVDNKSDDYSVEFLNKEYPDIKVIKLSKNCGFAIPNNLAAKTAKGKYLVFLNNDTIVKPTWLEELLKCLEKDDRIKIAQSLLLKPDSSVDSSGDFIDHYGRAYSKHDIPKKPRNILSAKAACMIIEKEFFLDLGGFDESYFATFEDVELGWRCWLYGFKVILVPSSIVIHKGGETIKKLHNEISFHGVKNNISLRLTHLDFWDSCRTLFSMFFILFFKKFFRFSIVNEVDQKFNIPNISTVIKAFFWILKNLNKISKKRKHIRSRMTTKNQELKNLGLIN